MVADSTMISVLIDEEMIRERVNQIGQQISIDYAGKDLILLGILKGSIFFLTDLARAIDLPLTVEFLGVSSYEGGTTSTGQVRITFDVSRSIQGRHVLVVEDIVDTGLTMNFLLDTLKARQPASIKVCTLLEKPSRARVEIPIDYRGFVV